MTEPFGKFLRLRVKGTSRSPEISCTLIGFPAGIPVSLAELQTFLSRRAPGNAPYSTARKEADVPLIRSGVRDGVTDGTPIAICIANTNADKQDAVDYSVFPRPSHADYAAVQKYGDTVDLRGGGHFSGRLTAPLCAAGYFCLQYLAQKDIRVYSHIASVGGVQDDTLDALHPDIPALNAVKTASFPTLSPEAGQKMTAAILAAKEEQDSLGGVIECAVTGLPAGVGEHLFGSVEEAICSAVFAIPGVKGVEFGDGFTAAARKGSENNDGYRTDGSRVSLESNHAGGVLGGMTTGAPLVFRVACKPTPSIGKSQHTVNLHTMENAEIRVAGRNDPCFVPRAVPAVEAAAALALCDLMLADIPDEDTLPAYRKRIDNADAAIADAFAARMEAALHIGSVKQITGGTVYQPAREAQVLDQIRKRTPPAFQAAAEAVSREILIQSKAAQNAQTPVLYPGCTDKKIILIGNPLGHSLSVPIHKHLSDYSYTCRELSPEELPDFLQSKAFDGLNITVPYKKAVLPYLDTLSEEAKAIGAVNTVVKDASGKLCGCNTDVHGFAATLDRMPAQTEKRAVLLGNGGAAAAVRYVLEKRGYTVTCVTRKDPDTVHFDAMQEGLFDGALLVNCTPCGMFPEEGPSLLSDGQVASCSAIIDLIYNPWRTRLLQQAQRAGIPALNGFGMLVRQAVYASALFCGKEPAPSFSERIVSELTENTRNIVLIGMPGCGKSTTAAAIAKITGKRLFDTDKDIEERTGFAPAAYLQHFGEDAFRKEEAVSVRTAAHLRGAVIATGGGVVLSAENRYRLRASGAVYYLDRPLDALSLADRPITAAVGAEELYRTRLPLYAETADVTVPALSPQETAEYILQDFLRNQTK